MTDVVTSWDEPAKHESDTPAAAPVVSTWDEPPAKPQESRSSMTAVMQNAAYKGAAALPDMVLNAPNNLLNLGKAAVGTVATASGRPDLAPDLTPNPDLARRGLEAVGLINPKVVPRGVDQQAVDLLTQGAVGGALTGGASIPRTVAGAALGAASAGAAGGTEAMTGNQALAASAGIAVPAVGARVVGGGGARLSPDKQLLKDEGVQMTLGQIKGGIAKRLEDAATSIPFVGDIIKGAQRRSIESFNEAAINRSLAPIGEKLPAGMSGNKAIDYAYGKLGDAYEALLPNLKGDLHAVPGAGGLPKVAGQAAAPSFRQELDKILSMGDSLPEPQKGQLHRIVDREILQRFTEHGKASGETLKEIESKLGTLSKKMGKSDDYDVRTLGDAVQEAQNAMRRMVEHVNPEYKGQLDKINDGYANFKKAQNAAGSVSAPQGVFSPADLHRAVKAGDISKDKARFAEGNARMQDLSSAGKTVLPSSVPDSGTPLRAAVMYAISHPAKAVGLGIPLSLAALPYTSIGQRFGQHFLTNPDAPLSAVSSRVSPIAADIGMHSE